VVFEVGLGLLMGATPAVIAADYDLAHGGLMPLGLLMLLLGPFLAASFNRHPSAS
jgi:hypothetical protein